MIRSLFILSIKGEIIIEKHWGGYVDRSIVDQFMDNIGSDFTEVLPIIITHKFYLINIQINDLFFLSPVQGDVPPLFVIEFLYRVVDLFKEYFKDVSEEGIKNNFVTVYQLLDEMMDSGMPFMTEPNILKVMIHPPSLMDVWPMSNESDLSLPEGALTNVPWRKIGIKYATNEIFFDIFEDIDTIIDQNGLVITSKIAGHIACQCHLSGMPDLTLRFTNSRLIDDTSFHPCVRYSRWENERIISFVPPDGNFELMKYRIYQQIQPPMYCKPQITYGNTGGKLSVMIGPKANQGKTIEDIKISIPFPEQVASVTFEADIGKVAYDELTKVLTWTLNKMPKEKTPILNGNISLIAGSEPPKVNPSCSVKFRVNTLACSGLKVDSLSVHVENYKPYKGVRSITRGGRFEIRC
eukprot:TRINITY_DN13_c0_g4_i1.p1 TRINITY_DN13_c0_g4~~TRINITY_DN13_c0_g4_i1.p1  ORF type:complete len:409 (-),score=121.55 TRINITY_DN13_c0_g4_i1:149-1375(-)